MTRGRSHSDAAGRGAGRNEKPNNGTGWRAGPSGRTVPPPPRPLGMPGQGPGGQGAREPGGRAAPGAVGPRLLRGPATPGDGGHALTFLSSVSGGTRVCAARPVGVPVDTARRRPTCSENVRFNSPGKCLGVRRELGAAPDRAVGPHFPAPGRGSGPCLISGV